MRANLTYAGLREMPEDGWRHELPEGDLVGSPAPAVRKQRMMQKVNALLIEAERAGAGVVPAGRRARCWIPSATPSRPVSASSPASAAATSPPRPASGARPA